MLRFLVVGLAFPCALACDAHTLDSINSANKTANNAADTANTVMRLANGFGAPSSDTMKAHAAESCPGGAGIAGKYGVRDVRYHGDVCFRAVDQSFDILWTLTSGEVYEGVALVDGDTVAVGFSDQAAGYGVVLYRIQGGHLDGKWTVPGANGQVGTEVLDGPASLDGEFRIASSSTPGAGHGYSGSVEIHPTGSTYDMTWKLTHETYRGVAIREGDLLVVGWGETGHFGVVSYRAQANMLRGHWAFIGDSSVQIENLARQ